MKGIELGEFDLDARARTFAALAFGQRQRELDLRARQRFFEVVELDRHHLAPRQVGAGLQPAARRTTAEVAEHRDAHGTLRGPRRRGLVEGAEIRGPVGIVHQKLPVRFKVARII